MNNAGGRRHRLLLDIPFEDHTPDANLKGVIYGARAALRQFGQQGYGTLINTDFSTARPRLACRHLRGKKAAVLSLSHSLNRKLRLAAADDIKVGTIMPWAVDTPWWIWRLTGTSPRPRDTSRKKSKGSFASDQRPTGPAEDLLQLFHATLRQHQEHRDAINAGLVAIRGKK